MREILFRGKRLDNGEWAEGYLGQDTIIGNGNTWLGYVIKPIPKKLWDCDWFEIDPTTIGQYTGLTDKNGAKIFEGDILQFYDDEIQVVEWSEAWSQIMLHTYGEHERKVGRKTVKEKFEGWNDLHDYPLEDMPILGNIHDNPELMKDGEVGC